MSALEGMKEIIKKNQDLKIFTEFWPRAIKKSGYPPEEFISKLLASGFQVYLMSSLKRVGTYDEVRRFVKKSIDLFATREEIGT